MLQEESSNTNKQERKKHFNQNKNENSVDINNNLIDEVSDHEKMNIEDDKEELSGDNESEDISGIEDEKQVKIQKKSVSLPETSLPKNKQIPPVRNENLSHRSSTKDKKLDINDFEEINCKRVKTPEEFRNEGFEMLEEILKSQIDDHKLLLKELMYVDKNQAVQVKRTIKTFEEDLRIVKLAHSTPNVPLPLYTIEERNVKFEIANFEISEHELQIEIEKMIDVKPAMSSKDPYPGYYITCSFQHPEATQKFKTVTTNTYLFNHTHNFIIDRQKKLDKKKIVIEVYKPGQWFSESVLFGRCEFPLTDLFNSCTHHGILNIIKEKKKVASLFVTLRVKYPLKERKYETKNIRQVIIKKHFGSYEEYENYNKEKNIKQSNKDSEEERNQSKEESIHISEVPDTKVTNEMTTSKQKKIADSSPRNDDKNQTKSSYYLVPLDHLFSIGVLEYEKSRTTQLLQDAKKNKNDDSIFELEQRLSEINSKIMILNYQAQSGQLTQEDYVEIVKKRIEEELLIARKLKSTNKEAALEAMRRKKIMEKELSGG